jgi:alpha-ketoglutaric semialdehyde dehydrogenase
MSFIPHGRNLIAGEWVGGASSFQSRPASGPAHSFASGTAADIDAACAAAEAAFWVYGWTSRQSRADFLLAIAAEIEARGADITEIAHQETGLPTARLEGERGRTTGQLRLFAAHILKGDYLDHVVDPALPDRLPAPRPEIRLMQRPIGPVAVFGASNFPLAFSTAGGDTASALAAGCPVVVKGHPAHPGTGEIIAEAIKAAIEKTGMPKGCFSFIHGDTRAAGEALVKHPRIQAVGFTGSIAGGRALFDLCAARPSPIPFFGELGSVNPNFVLPAALSTRGLALANGWAASLTMGAGQFCTNPGVMIVPQGAGGDSFVAAAAEALAKIAPQVMLSDAIAEAYRCGTQRMAQSNAIRPVYLSPSEGRIASPNLYEISAASFLADRSLSEEVFGPLGLVVRTGDADEMRVVAQSFEGQLTATIHMEEADLDAAQSLLPILERMAGRVLVNGFSTGVEVVDAMMHGGPYPASTNVSGTSVGTMAIRRFLRPVSYQNLPAALLPQDL